MHSIPNCFQNTSTINFTRNIVVCVISRFYPALWPQPAVWDLLKYFCKKIWDESKKIMLRDNHSSDAKVGIFKMDRLTSNSCRFVVFRCDNIGFVIFEFWLRPQSAVWDLLKSFCKKSEMNQKKLCSEKCTHLRSNVKMSKFCELSSYSSHFMVFSAW